MFLVVLAINYALMRFFTPGEETPITIPYTVFKEQVAQSNVTSIYSQGDRIEGRFVRPFTWPSPKASGGGSPSVGSKSSPRTSHTFESILPTFIDPGFERFLDEHKVEIQAVPIQTRNLIETLLYGFGPALFIIAFYVWMYRRAAQGGGGDGRGFWHGQKQSAPLRSGYRGSGHVRRCGGHRRGRERACRDRRFPQGSGQVFASGWFRAQGGIARWRPGHRQDLARQGRGRAAEEVVYGTRTTGAENDIEQATGLARNMVTRWGMSDKLGLVQLAGRQNPYLGNTYGGGPTLSEQTSSLVDSEVQAIISECHSKALTLLREHRRALDALVQALLDHETLDEKEICEATGLPPAPPLEELPHTPV
nr:ATP-dependent metallopeptidase FtsH/Yme1/Tma family protein [Castellaniella sp.]